jgi:hypothetical protein
MKTPGFTAEASLGTRNNSYALTSQYSEGEGRVSPQGTICGTNEDGVRTCTTCFVVLGQVFCHTLVRAFNPVF